MASYLTPGIYIEEVSTGTRPIGMVGTSIAAFVGYAPLLDASPDQAVACNNWSQFVRQFVGDGNPPSTDLARAVYGFFDNGGSRCYVVNLGKSKSIAGDSVKRTGLASLEVVDEVAIVAAPGFSDLASYDALLSHCERMQDRIAILDAPQAVDNTDQLKQVGTQAAEDSPDGKSAKQTTGLRPRTSERGFGAIYFPWIVIRDPLDSGSQVAVPPSGHLAGVYARSDARRGVHKAPANESIRGALGLTYRVTGAEQGELNRAGINCIRFFPDSGIKVWGARTLADEASEWRYINVRRLFNMIEESIEEGTRWTVFEPNDQRLWKSVVRDVSAFLTTVWRDGALKGVSAEQAFFVKCDEETNPPEVIDAGRLVVEIGIAPVKPSEFIIFRIGQWSGGGGTEADTESEASGDEV